MSGFENLEHNPSWRTCAHITDLGIRMPISPQIMRFLLLVCVFMMAGLAIDFLRRRELSPWAHALWGLLAIILPLLGPFLVIWLCPGRRAHLHRG